MDERWAEVAERAVTSLGVQPAEIVSLRDRSGRYDVVAEMLLAVERRGATALIELIPPGYLERLLASTSPGSLAKWDQHRLAFGRLVDRVLVLGEAEADLGTVAEEALDEWLGAVHRLTDLEEGRRIPTQMVAIPTEGRARRLGLSLVELDSLVAPAISASPEELRGETGRMLGALEGASTLTIESGDTHLLRLVVGGRRWMRDVGMIPVAGEQPEGTQVVMNLPAGAVYTTVLEGETSGSLWLPEAGEARGVLLEFEGGRVVKMSAKSGADRLEAMFDGESGESRRVSHVGIGLNPYLQRSVGWVLVDEHRKGNLFIAFGENRYLGGENASSLNVDFVIPEASLLVDGGAIVRSGRLTV